jgi:hypothetical protein
MPAQLDILALEPFYGGIRRAMLDTVIRCSRHRWTLLKLPPRRMERRLSVAANWFAEQLSRHWSGRLDLLFTSEAMNLASLYRLVPALATPPSVVYFHDNQLPDPQRIATKPRPTRGSIGSKGQLVVAPPPDASLELVNLNTATAATEIWFNSVYHLKTFLGRATNLVARHPELSSHNPMLEVTRRAHVMPPPIDMNIVPHVKASMAIAARDPKAIFVETRDADLRLLNAGLSMLAGRGVSFRLITVGPVEDLSPQWPRRTLSEADDFGQVAALWEAGAVLSVRPGAACDYQVIRGLLAGCRPVLPDRGVYGELLPGSLHAASLYPATSAKGLADRLQEAIQPVFSWHPPDFRQSLKHFEAIAACRAFDERLEQLVVAPKG